MQIEEIKKVFESKGMSIVSSHIDGYYKVNGGGKHRSHRSLIREAKSIVKQQKKALRRGVK